jgi:hypothetical protein
MAIMVYMNGIPVSEIAKRLDITSEAVKMRFKRRGIKPFKYIGPTGLYTDADIDAIKDAYLGKHPSKKETSKSKPATAKSKVSAKTGPKKRPAKKS